MAKNQKITHRPVLVLGAGASFGAYISDGTRNGIETRTPPLDSDFFKAAKRAFGIKGASGPQFTAWREFRKALVSVGINEKRLMTLRLEELATYLEARTQLAVQHTSGRPYQYEKALKLLKQVICFTLKETNGTKYCRHLRQVISLLDPVAIVTFNYDLIAEQTLLKMKKFNWSAHSYCSSQKIELVSKAGRRKTAPIDKRVRPAQAIPVLKLHGSINWKSIRRQGIRKNQRVVLAGMRSYPSQELDYSRPPAEALIVPPVASKTEIKDELKHVWRIATRHLRDSSRWVVWGYSFPWTDTVTSVLMRTALWNHRGGFKPLWIINPDSKVSDNAKRILEKVRVEQWYSIERFILERKSKAT